VLINCKIYNINLMLIFSLKVSGSAPNFGSDFPKVCDIVGRISSDTVWDYISKTKKVGSKVIGQINFYFFILYFLLIKRLSIEE